MTEQAEDIMSPMNLAEITDAQYQILASRRQNYDSMVWQTPVISLTAQAFLFTIALGQVPTASRIIASLLAFIAALASIQLLSRHRHFEIYFSELLKEIETAKHWPAAHARPADRSGGFGISSYYVWTGVFCLFAAAAVIACSLALRCPTT
jgi:hypothetical protein